MARSSCTTQVRWAGALLLTLLATWVLATGAHAAAAPASGGTATVVADHEPLCLNPLRTTCNSIWATSTAGAAVPGAFRVRPDSSLEPMLVDRVDVERSPFALTYHLKAAATWSDGTPVSADDLLFTHAAIVDPANQVADRSGHHLVVGATKLGPKTARFVFSEPYARWRSMFRAILPKHALEGRDFDTVWQSDVSHPDTGEPLGAGPFLVTEWNAGHSLTLSRNPAWWGPQEPFLETITVRFIPDLSSQFAAIRDGTADVLVPLPNSELEELRSRPELVVQARPSAALQHLDFRVSAPQMPLLAQTWFRQAVLHALDRASVFTHVWGGMSPDLGVRQSLTFPQGHPGYHPAFARYGYSASAIAGLMLAHGCAVGGDGIWSCGGTRASIKFATVTGNSVYEAAQQRLIDGARAMGIELVPDNSPSPHLFGVRLPAGDFELIMYAWIISADPGPISSLYACGGDQNYQGYCSAQTDALAAAADAEVDPDGRAALLNAVNDAVAEDAVTVPVFERPSFLVSRRTLQGPASNPAGSPLWNVEDWFHGSFADVPPSNFFYGYIEQLSEHGITQGCATNADGRRLYCPGDFVPRQQMAAFLIRAKGLTQLHPPTPTFADVPQSNPFYGYIERLYEQGITTGCGTNGQGQLIYCPDDFVPRQQMAAFLIRAKGLTQLPSPTPTFADVPQSNFFYGYVERLYEQGITTGCGTNGQGQLIYCPDDFVPRQQMAAFLIRAFG